MVREHESESVSYNINFLALEIEGAFDADRVGRRSTRWLSAIRRCAASTMEKENIYRILMKYIPVVPQLREGRRGHHRSEPSV